MEPINLSSVLTGIDPKPACIVDGFLYQDQMVVVAGEPGVGKSFFQYTLAMCIAAGIPFMGMEVVQGPVLYFDEENGRADLRQYLRWIWRGLGQPDIDALQENLYIEHFSLARQATKRYVYMAEVAANVKPCLIIVDTATPCCAIQDENDNAEASRAVRQLRLVKEVAGPDTTIVILKHSKFSHDLLEKQTIRGAKTWLGEVDGVVYHKLAAGKPRSDGLRNGRLVPDKVRAFGLREELIIHPIWTGEGNEKGISLGRKDIPR